MSQDVKFLALPSYQDLVRKDAAEKDLCQYESAMWRIRREQEKAAVIACKILRPDDYRKAKHTRDFAVHEANSRFREEVLAVFSEQCTRGL